MKKIIALLDDKVKIKKLVSTRVESVMFDVEDFFDILMGVEGMDEELANRIVQNIKGLMTEED